MAFIQKEKTALLRWGNVKSRPFGVALKNCHSNEKCDSPRKFMGISQANRYGVRQVNWICEKHGDVSQVFDKSLVGWWTAGKAGHLARWNEIIDPPSPI